MKKLIERVEGLKKNEGLKNKIDDRIREFTKIRKRKSDEEIFSELCFCLMTANFQAEKSWKIQKEMGPDLWKLSEEELKIKLKEKGHRFWPQRGTRIYQARKLKQDLIKNLERLNKEKAIRKWLVENINGLGMKEASHFLRNVGYFDVAIIDKHIINLLVMEGLIEKPKTISPKKYLEIEKLLNEVANKTSLSLGELDLYLWSEETGKVLK
jgi:N-glycosylase/DNA lyase